MDRENSSSPATSLVVKPRGKASIEVKSRYLLGPDAGARRERFTVDLHFFLPASFRVGPDTYERPQFYRDAKTHVRFDTPQLDLESILATECSDSPLVRLEKMAQAAEDGGALRTDTLLYESKLLAAVYKSLLRRMVGGLDAVVPADAVDGDPSDLYDDEFELETDADGDQRAAPPDPSPGDLRALYRVVKRTHKLTRSLLSVDRISSAHQHLRMIDEHISLLLERYLSRYLEFVEDHDFDAAGRKRITKMLIAESEYRRRAEYPTALDGNLTKRDLEAYVYREKMLKKYASEVLFLGVKTHDEAKTTEHILYAAAAGIAMVFATAVGFYAQTVYGGISAAVFLLLVVSYMVKDRLKDIFRSYFQRSAGGRFYDRRTNLYDGIWNKRLARVRERTSFVGEKRVDPAIARARARGSFEEQLATSAAESHLVYRKVVDIKASTLRRIHSRIRGLADILILDLQPMLRHLASQSTSVPVVSGGELQRIEQAQRVYHLNLVADGTWRGERRVSRFRLVVDRDGIRRIEAVSTLEPESPS